jgi:predicted HD superfamily hydrolase involved in NAD metabolism
MSDYRFTHVLRVEQMALVLAGQWGADLEAASIAALTHDYAKERSDADFIATIKAQNLDPELLKWGNNVWHGIVGAELVRSELGITDPQILSAIQKHTTGAAVMTLLDKIIYMADYVEAGRDFDGIDEVRALAQTDLDASVGWQAGHTLAYLAAKRVPIYPLALETYNAWAIKTQKNG